jgi:hypothetical protein
VKSSTAGALSTFGYERALGGELTSAGTRDGAGELQTAGSNSQIAEINPFRDLWIAVGKAALEPQLTAQAGSASSKIVFGAAKTFDFSRPCASLARGYSNDHHSVMRKPEPMGLASTRVGDKRPP